MLELFIYGNHNRTTINGKDLLIMKKIYFFDSELFKFIERVHV